MEVQLSNPMLHLSVTECPVNSPIYLHLLKCELKKAAHCVLTFRAVEIWGSPFYQAWACIWEALFAATLLSGELSLFYWSPTLKTDTTTTCHSNRGAAHRMISHTALETEQHFCAGAVVMYEKQKIFLFIKTNDKTTEDSSEPITNVDAL